MILYAKPLILCFSLIAIIFNDFKPKPLILCLSPWLLLVEYVIYAVNLVLLPIEWLSSQLHCPHCLVFLVYVEL